MTDELKGLRVCTSLNYFERYYKTTQHRKNLIPNNKIKQCVHCYYEDACPWAWLLWLVNTLNALAKTVSVQATFNATLERFAARFAELCNTPSIKLLGVQFTGSNRHVTKYTLTFNHRHTTYKIWGEIVTSLLSQMHVS